MSSFSLNRQARRAAKITGAMIDHAVAIFENADEACTHVEDGEVFVCVGCVAKCLRANWGFAVQRPTTDEHWELLGRCALDVIVSEKALEEPTAQVHPHEQEASGRTATLH